MAKRRPQKKKQRNPSKIKREFKLLFALISILYIAVHFTLLLFLNLKTLAYFYPGFFIISWLVLYPFFACKKCELETCVFIKSCENIALKLFKRKHKKLSFNEATWVEGIFLINVVLPFIIILLKGKLLFTIISAMFFVIYMLVCVKLAGKGCNITDRFLIRIFK